MLRVLRSLWNWFTSLFTSCLPGHRHHEEMIAREESLPLLASESEAHDDAGQQQPAASHLSAAVVIAELRRLPAATLTTEEFCDVMADAYEGKTTSLDAMHNPAKQEVGYKLIHQFAMQYVAEIDRDVAALKAANPLSYTIQTSWKNLRTSVVTGNMDEHGIAYTCDEFSSKHLPKDDFNAAAQQHAWLENIKTCFSLCKKLMAAYRKYTISQEREDAARRAAEMPKFDPMTEETRMNAKTLKMVNDFNKRCEEAAREEEAALAASHTHRGRGRYGTNKF